MFRFIAALAAICAAASATTMELNTKVVFGASAGPYEKPPCASGEEAISITGLQGDVCSPSCSATSPCPAAPAGATAQPECALEKAGSSSPTNCALICSPSAGGCPTGATCEAIQGTGICMYE